ncbi:MAG TPA: PepSY-associated TM helix domain-containing protein [Candidatus Polarisedimenticolia bacterium]|nr:PepSY-associated TM helix domain-containing protein [Candidatus Polarisedimenticolia bacterium]
MDAQTNPGAIATEAPQKKRRPPGALLFLPAFANRTEVIQWLKRIHAWTGFWGALAFLLIGTSGMLLNHRATLKIDTGAPVEVNEAAVTVDPALIKSPDDLGKWAQAQFGTRLEPRAPRAEGGRDRQGREGGEHATLMGKEIQQTPVWKQSFTGANAVLNVEYSPGSTSVKVSKSEQNFLGVLKNLHKGVGMSWPWVLLIDTFAGGLIAMSLTGALLWSRLHGPRLAALGIVTASLGLALFAAWPSLI